MHNTWKPLIDIDNLSRLLRISLKCKFKNPCLFFNICFGFSYEGISHTRECFQGASKPKEKLEKGGNLNNSPNKNKNTGEVSCNVKYLVFHFLPIYRYIHCNSDEVDC